MGNKISINYNTEGSLSLDISSSFNKLSKEDQLSFMNDSVCILNSRFIELLQEWIEEENPKMKH